MDPVFKNYHLPDPAENGPDPPATLISRTATLIADRVLEPTTHLRPKSHLDPVGGPGPRGRAHVPRRVHICTPALFLQSSLLDPMFRIRNMTLQLISDPETFFKHLFQKKYLYVGQILIQFQNDNSGFRKYGT